MRCRAIRGVGGTWKPIYLLLCLASLANWQPLSAATSADTVVENRAEASGQFSNGSRFSVSSNVDRFTVESLAQRTAATVELLRYDPAGNSTPTVVSPTAFQAADGSWQPIPPPASPMNSGGTVLDRPLPLVPAEAYRAGEVLFVRLSDGDQNRNATLVDTVEVTLRIGAGEERETLRLREGGEDSGVFVGYIPLTDKPAYHPDGQLGVGQNTTLHAVYSDPDDPTDEASDSTLVDPSGVVFSSVTGRRISGVAVTLMDHERGGPATIRGSDGVSTFPSTVVTGSEIADSGGTVYKLGEGEYIFPVVDPGQYRLEVSFPNGADYVWPSKLDQDMSGLPGGPYAIVPGSRGEAFAVGLSSQRLDIPVDPRPTNLLLTKSAGKREAAIGDFVEYHLEVTNPDRKPALEAVHLVDQLPPGFRYETGSARLNGKTIAADDNGRTLTFRLGRLEPDKSLVVTYVARVATARSGQAVSEAQASSGLSKSNSARASVLVTDDLMRDQAIILGRIERIENGRATGAGVANIRVLLEDGSYAVSDGRGMFHLEGLEPGLHVVQLDLDTLPRGYQAVLHEKDTRSAGRPWSRFVELQAGSTWQVRFYLEDTAPAGEAFSVRAGAYELAEDAERVREQMERRHGVATLALEKGETDVWRVRVGRQPTWQGADRLAKTLRAEFPGAVVVKLKAAAGKSNVEVAEEEQDKPAVVYDQEWIDLQPPGAEWVAPSDGALPAIPSVRVVVKHLPQQSVALYVNSRPVDPINFDGVLTSSGKTVSASVWSGVDVSLGDVMLEVVRTDSQNREVGREQRHIHVSSAPVRAELAPELSRLVVDGRTEPILMVRLLDKDGYPARIGTVGELSVYKPHQLARTTPYDARLLEGVARQADQYVVGEAGLAEIRLEPTTVSGSAHVRLQLLDEEVDIRANLRAEREEWILVGIAEGSLGYQTIKSQSEPLGGAQSGTGLETDGRIALYAQGRIRGGWILTLSFDNKKPNRDFTRLHGMIDPDAYYTVYGDQNGRYQAAASQRKLYIKLEKDAASVLLGDYHLDWTLTELTTYERDFSGLRANYDSGRVNAEVFAADSDQSFMRDEFLGEGTTGPYQLSRPGIVLFSETIAIEIRDRFRSELVKSRRPLTRNIDYTIDERRGRIMLREPLFSTNHELDHQFLVARYEVMKAGAESRVFGGRVEVNPNEKLRVGVTHISENGSEARLSGVDLRYQAAGRTEFRGEAAMSGNDISGQDATAFLGEITHHGESLEARAYIRQSDSGFGLGQRSRAEDGTQKISVEGTYKLADKLMVAGSRYRQKQLDTGYLRNLSSASVMFTQNHFNFIGGLRRVADQRRDVKQVSNQITAGVTREFPDRRLRLRAEHEHNFGSGDPSIDFPTRTIAGIDYLLNPTSTLFAQQEWTQSTLRNAGGLRIGMRTTPWAGGEVIGSVRQPFDGSGAAASSAIRQRWLLTERFSVDGAIEHSTAMDGNAAPFDPDRPFTVSPGGDFTAVSVGTTWNPDGAIYNARIEWRGEGPSHHWNLLASHQTAPGRELGFLTSLVVATGRRAAGGLAPMANLRFGAAYRPARRRWTILDRLDFIRETGLSNYGLNDAWKIVNNMNLNYKVPSSWQVSFKPAIKYTWERMDGAASFSGFTPFLATEFRRNLGPRWDIGSQLSLLYGHDGRQYEYGYGLSLGYQLMTNMWVSLGYNLRGVEDRDFSAARLSNRGFVFRFRMKFDQETVAAILNGIGED